MEKELFDDFGQWVQALTLDGCGLRKDWTGLWWAENWEGKSCGEFDPTTNTGFLQFG